MVNEAGFATLRGVETEWDGGRRNRNNQFSGDKQDGGSGSAGDEIERMIPKWQMPKKMLSPKIPFHLKAFQLISRENDEIQSAETSYF